MCSTEEAALAAKAHKKRHSNGAARSKTKECVKKEGRRRITRPKTHCPVEISGGEDENISYYRYEGIGTASVYVFEPSHQQISNFPRLIQLIEKTGAHLESGICKIVPPAGWSPRPSKKSMKNIDDFIIKNAVEETIERRSDGCYVKDVSVYRKEMTVREFRTLANSAKYRNRNPGNSHEETDSTFWSNVLEGSPIYGADVEGSLYDEGVTSLNPAKLNTILDEIKPSARIHGVNTVYLYFGMYKTMFPWHVEDMDLYSINYLHEGAPKHWYAVSSESGDRLERLLSQSFPEERRRCDAFHRHKNFIIAPSTLAAHNIPFGTMVQKKNEFIITFPWGFHMGFNTGYNIAESTNFASPRWIDFGKNAMLCNCRPDSVQINMNIFMEKFRPAQFTKWRDYWYAPNKMSIRQFAGKKSRKRLSEPNYCEDESKAREEMATIAKRARKLFENSGLWSHQTLDLYAEKEYNKKAALHFPHCSVCQYFQNKHLAYSTKTLPSRSKRLLRNYCFSKQPGPSSSTDTHPSEEEDDLVQCANCQVAVHPSCYCNIDIPQGKEEIKSWLCMRCRQSCDMRIRSAACHLCELRGGALIKGRAGRDPSFVHVGCAILNRSFLRREYLEVMEDEYESSKFQCVVCETNKEGLLRCVSCFEKGEGAGGDEGGATRNAQWEPTLAHATCALIAGMRLELRDFPTVATLYCNLHEEAAERFAVGEEVIVMNNRTRQEEKGRMGEESETAVTPCILDFYDGTTSEDCTLSDIVQCECEDRCGGSRHVPGARVVVLWQNDQKMYPAYFRRSLSPEVLLVHFSDGSSRYVEIANIYKVKNNVLLPHKKAKKLA